MWNIFGDGPLEWSEDADAVLYARIDGPLAWQQHALCAQTDPEAFFPEKGGSTREAKAVCQACQDFLPLLSGIPSSSLYFATVRRDR